MIDAKRELREKMRALRSGMGGERGEACSLCIFKRLKNMPEWEGVRRVFCYLSFGSEVRTDEILRWLLDGGKKVYVPVVCGDHMRLADYRLGAPMRRGAFGIREPEQPVFYDGEVDVALVPGLAFTEQGGRMGYGGGYYDRFLAGSRALTIALAYELQILRELPLESHDLSMQRIVTEQRVIYAAKSGGQGWMRDGKAFTFHAKSINIKIDI